MKGFATINHNGGSLHLPKVQIERLYAANVICKTDVDGVYKPVPGFSLRNVDDWLERQDKFERLVDHMKALGWTELETGEVYEPSTGEFPNWFEAIVACIEVAMP